MSEKTYWNGEPAECRRVMVRVAESDDKTPPFAWWRGLEGTVRKAVEVKYHGEPFYLDDDDITPEIFAAHRAACEADPKVSKLLAALPANERNHEPGRAGDGWEKVTIGKGSPSWGHRSYPVAEVLGDAP